VAEWLNATACKAVQPVVRIHPSAPFFSNSPGTKHYMKLAKGIKVPTSVKAMAALQHPLDRHAEKAAIRAEAAAIHANETRARNRGKEKKEESEAAK
jgi:hypothetical protein